MNPRTLIRCLCIAICALTLRANAQAQGPNEILDASKAAIAEIAGFTADFEMKGEGGSMFKDTLPSMVGKLYFGTNEELGKVIRCVGQAKDQQTTPWFPFDILISADRYIWTDTPSKIIHERPVTSSSRGLSSAIPLVLIRSLINDDPFANDANNAQSIELLDPQTVGDTLCQVIHIKRAKATGRSSRSPSDSYTDARWYIGTEDKLPRKLEHITDAGLVKITLLFEFTTLAVGSPTQEQLDVERPEGFTLRSTMPSPKTEPTPITQGTPPIRSAEDPRTPQTQPEPITPKVVLAPDYSFTTVDGRSISQQTQVDRVTVFYFWGSWCIPCTITSPEVSEMAKAFEDQPVDVFGIAIREADLDRTADDFALANYHHNLVLDGEPVASQFKVRVYPTLIVINQAGEIVAQQSISKQTPAEKLVPLTTKAIQTELDSK